LVLDDTRVSVKMSNAYPWRPCCMLLPLLKKTEVSQAKFSQEGVGGERTGSGDQPSLRLHVDL